MMKITKSRSVFLRFIFLISFFLASSLGFADSLLWKDISQNFVSANNTLAAKSSASGPTALKHRAVELDEEALKKILFHNEPVSARHLNASITPVVFDIPLPDGTWEMIRAIETTIMAPELAAQFPGNKTWKVTGVDKHIEGRIDFTGQGFHAMLTMPSGDTVFIDPDKDTTSQYLSFSKRSNIEQFHSDFQCGVHSNDPLVSSKSLFSAQTSARPAPDLITYRLAVAATGEYTQFHGGSKSSAFDAIFTTINRVNDMFERDLGITLQLVAEELDLIYTDSLNDPYSNDNVQQLLVENIDNLSSEGVLSTTRYDIGHVFGTGNVGGLAVVGSVCNNANKAGGATSLSNPIGDAFNLDFVAHEIGHQHGATHTFNSLCSSGSARNPISAVEPGSGTTIMSYAGICGSNNIQFDVDPQFHAVSILQVLDFTRSLGGSACGTRQSSLNENPEANAGPDFTVPGRTPLRLMANGSDVDGDTLTYVWEQSDVGTASDLDVDTGNNAIFRSRPPTTSSIRYIPRLSDLFASTFVSGERVPVNNRDVEFVMTVRDGRGGAQADSTNMRVFDTGSAFRVTSHISNQTFGQGDETTVRWDVAGTNVSPISCSNVDISLITSNGNNQFITNTSNDGQQSITIPADATAMNNARFMLACSNSGFFNVSSAALTILNSPGSGGSSSGSGGGGSMAYLLVPFLFLLGRKYLQLRAIK